MTSLINDAISAMGSPTEDESAAASSSASISSVNTTKSSASSITLVDSFKDWWGSSSNLMHAVDPTNMGTPKTVKAQYKNRMIEYELFKAILSEDIYLKPMNPNGIFEPQSSSTYTGELIDVKIDDSFIIHEFYLENDPETPPEEQTHIVMIHGYMAALGFFIKNVETILKSKRGIRLHLIDIPGFGNSSRPEFPSEFVHDPKSIPDRILQILSIENWFIDSFEAWRIKRGIPQFKLIAHSMGAYLSSCYLMKYNGKGNVVKQFMLVSPMGTESSAVSLINDKKYQFNHHQSGGDPFKELDFHEQSDPLISEDMTKLWEKLGQPKFPKNYILEKIWKHHKSPFQILQNFGPLYSKILSYWSFQRFKNLQTNKDDSTSTKESGSVDTSNTGLILKLHNYSYSIFNQYQGSGELAITKLINHEILAKLPLCDRGFIEYLDKTKVRTSWIYGDKDWMNSKGGQYIHDRIVDLDSSLSEFKIIENAGHHIYLDNPTEFNQSVIEFFDLQD